MTQTQEHNHEHSNPIVISDDNVAKVNVMAEEHELEPYKKHYIKEKRKNVILKGFRKGAAPEAMVARFFKEEARQSARDNVIYSKYIKLLHEHKLQALSEPRVDHIHDEDGKIMASLVVDVLQPVILGQYLGLEIEKMPPVSIDAVLKNTLSEIRQSYPKLVDMQDTVVANKNVVIADFTVTDGEKELEKQTDFKVSVGVNLYFKLFEDQLLGMKVGENKEFDINFPETYHKEDFRNRLIHFNVTVKAIKDVAEYTDDELAKVLSYESKEKMMEALTGQIENKFRNDEHFFYENQILGELLSAHQFKIPNRLLSEEVSKIHSEHPEMAADTVKETADRFVRTDLVLHAIYERHPEIQFTQDQFNAKVADLAFKANDTVDNIIKKLEAAGKLQSYVNYLTNCKVIDFLIEMADMKETGNKLQKSEVITTVEEKENA